MQGIVRVGSLLALSMLLLVACSGEPPAAKTAPPLPVAVAVARLQAVPVELQAVGQVEASATVQVRSQVAGVITAVHFREGEELKKGTPLFTLDRTPLQAAVARAQADLNQARVEAANAARDAQRYAQLLVDGFISRNEAETAQARADALAAAVASSQASLDNATIQLGYATIRAPQDGLTGALLVHPGTVVRANDAPDLVTIRALQPVTVAFHIPERLLGEVRRHLATEPLRVSALLPGAAEPAGEGVVTFLDNSVDPATGTIRLKATFANSDRRLWPGQFVQVRVLLQTLEGALVVPTAAVQTGQQGSYLFVVGADATVASRAVSAGITWNDLTVIDSGLEAGATVVTDGQLRLFPGARVTVKTAAAESARTGQP
ncbi:efflux RND transporter periplasmic adaptor subunit [Desulfuromonas carbonis]|uniref:efflux RND transporter periplasmic adaptor subunit n=1 Tax=Desulfuromonas sp. DDH964 TaxID=1823759 RepID=UPI00078D9637|nr:efflux RND transporter periplasmic adaptor subunit [Desulfuromonas sp. DDH964]AMV72530.1 RND family efflux pump membrane fusion lipoprotein [Desulfuromonas sp. DDH964]